MTIKIVCGTKNIGEGHKKLEERVNDIESEGYKPVSISFDSYSYATCILMHKKE